MADIRLTAAVKETSEYAAAFPRHELLDFVHRVPFGQQFVDHRILHFGKRNVLECSTNGDGRSRQKNEAQNHKDQPDGAQKIRVDSLEQGIGIGLSEQTKHNYLPIQRILGVN